MLTNFFTRPLELNIGSYVYKFISTADFEFALIGRATVPSNKLSELFRYTKSDLKKESHAIGKIENKILEVLSQPVDGHNSIGRAVKEFDNHIFSHDHNWWNIFIALINKGDEYEPLLRIALFRYTQYLESRQELIKVLYINKGVPDNAKKPALKTRGALH